MDSDPHPMFRIRIWKRVSTDGVPHVCGSGRPTCGEYVCPGCARRVPNCFGAADELGELCDDCAVEVWNARRAAREELSAST
jgi:hypothetical protein